MPFLPPSLSRLGAAALLAAVPLAGCVPAPPSGPSYAVMPRQGEPLSQFQADDYACRDYAQNAAGNPAAAQQAETNNAVGTAAAGTLLGAAAGALLGAAGGNAGAGAAIGAGAGLVGGAAVGSNGAAAMGGSLQARYDVGYAQCMSTKGYQVPGGGGYAPAPGYAPAYGGPVYAPPPPPPPVVYEPGPYPFDPVLGFAPVFITGPGWYGGHYYNRRGFYGPHGGYIRGYRPGGHWHR